MLALSSSFSFEDLRYSLFDANTWIINCTIGRFTGSSFRVQRRLSRRDLNLFIYWIFLLNTGLKLTRLVFCANHSCFRNGFSVMKRF